MKAIVWLAGSQAGLSSCKQ